MPRNLRACLLFAAAALVIVSVISKSWLTIHAERGERSASAAIGLTRMELCLGECTTTWLASNTKDMSKREVVMTVAGIGTSATGALAAILCAVAGLGVFARRRGAAIAALVGVILAMLCAATYVASVKTRPEVEWGYAMGLFWLGTIVGFIGSITSMRRPAMQLGVLPTPLLPPCGACGNVPIHSAQYHRYYCGTCQRWL